MGAPARCLRADAVDIDAAPRTIPLFPEIEMTHSRKPLAAMIALGTALAMPMAFAQDATTAPPTEPTTHTDAAQPQTGPAQSTAPSATQQPLTWADLDVDGNGTLSRTEAGNLQSLAQVFDQADADGDGELTPDEYKSFVARSNAGQPEPDAAGGTD